MSGCITTDILLPIHSGLVGSDTGRTKEFVIMKMIDDGGAKQESDQVASLAINP